MSDFGPLKKGMVIPQEILGDTVRKTAINAHRLCLKHHFAHHVGQAQNYTDRATEMKTILSRHIDAESTFQDYLFALFGI